MRQPLSLIAIKVALYLSLRSLAPENITLNSDFNSQLFKLLEVRIIIISAPNEINYTPDF